MLTASPDFYSTADLQADASYVPLGGGFYAAALRSEYRIHPPADGETLILPAGTPLVCGHAGVFSEQVYAHLHGAFASSDLRLGVAILLGHQPDDAMESAYAASVRVEVDCWLNANTAFHFWPLGEMPPFGKTFGFFDGVVHSWKTRHTHVDRRLN